MRIKGGDNLDYKIGKAAREIRIGKGIKQSFISEKLGFKYQSSYADIETGRRKLSADKVPILAEALGVSLDELFFGNDIRKTRKGELTS
jgi:transcriptional regulator with XRE-family HTH domain